MAKKLRFICSECGHISTGWTGRCPECGAWGTMEEAEMETGKRSVSTSPSYSGAVSAKRLREVRVDSSARLDTGLVELNRVLGGGLVRDSVTMLTARPGAGKSTLLLQVAGSLAMRGIRALYASGEESESQIKSRAERILPEIPEEIFLLSTDSCDRIIEECRRLKPQVLFLDSVQTAVLSEYPQRAGSPTQTVQVTAKVVELCKDPGNPVAAFLVGHMTKGDEMAGLRTLEHLVDTVLFLDASDQEPLRILRSTKNRFGYTGEIGLFRMDEDGLEEISDPYSMFLTKRKAPVPGAAVTLQREGSRLIPVEIEALVSPNYTQYPVRIGDSLKRDDLNTLISILEQKGGRRMYDKNVVLKTTGGLVLREKASDLAILCAIASSDTQQPIEEGTLFLAEVGLTGELKRVSECDRRLREAERLGFRRAFVAGGSKIPTTEHLKVRAVTDLRSVFREIFGNADREN